MTSWPKDELKKIAETDDLHISPYREDGKTYGTPTWIWSVVVENNLYVRAYSGPQSRWYVAATKQKKGRITAASFTYEVAFLPVHGSINELINEAYKKKYKGNVYVESMVSEPSLSATIMIIRLDPT